MKTLSLYLEYVDLVVMVAALGGRLIGLLLWSSPIIPITI